MSSGARASPVHNFELIEFFKKVRTKEDVTLSLQGDR